MMLESGANPRPFLFTHPQLRAQPARDRRRPSAGDGSVDEEADRDGVIRRVPLFIVADGHLVPNLALEMLRVATGARAIGIVTRQRRRARRHARINSSARPTGAAAIYPYFTPSYDARYISAADLLDGTYDPARLNGAAVLLGDRARWD